MQGQYKKAVADLSKAIRLEPKYLRAYNNRGFVYSKLGELDKAVADLTEAIRLDPKYGEAYFNRATVYEQQHNLERAALDRAKYNELRASRNDR